MTRSLKKQGSIKGKTNEDLSLGKETLQKLNGIPLTVRAGMKAFMLKSKEIKFSRELQNSNVDYGILYVH